MTNSIASGTVHKVSEDMQKSLLSNRKILDIWNGLTPLARNEWICWCITLKKEETRIEHIERMIEQLGQGKRRPCCWIGCIHRTDKAISPSVRSVLNRKNKSK